MKNKTINILGTQYKIEIKKISEDKILKDNNYCGYWLAIQSPKIFKVFRELDIL